MAKIVFFVDDQAYAFTTLKDWLNQYGLLLEYETDPSRAYEKALQFFKQGELSVLLLDIIMPPGDNLDDNSGGRETGIILAQKLRQAGINTPIIFWSVVTDGFIAKNAATIGCSQFISKLVPSKIIAEICAGLISIDKLERQEVTE
jgi:CheY-like chemotaxis protein